jgi:hypothetical protein
VQISSCTTISDLPQELLVEVLRHVPLPLRIGRCSLVCTAWHAAAPAATSSINTRTQGAASDDDPDDLWELEEEDAAATVSSSGNTWWLEQWLLAHGGTLTQFSAKGPSVMQLPFAQLRRLQSLTCFDAQLQELHTSASSNSSSVSIKVDHHQQDSITQQAPDIVAAAAAAAAAVPEYCSSSSKGPPLQTSLCSLTSLTALRLRRVKYGCSGGLAALSLLTGLQQLQLVSVSAGGPGQQQYDAAQQQVGWLSSLTQLRRLHLELSSPVQQQGAGGAFSGLQQLQELTLRQQTYSAISLDMLQGLPPSITMLRLNISLQEPFSISTVPALAQLSALRHLQVWEVLPPATLWHELEPGSGVRVGFLSSLSIRQAAQLQVVDLHSNMCANTMPSLLRVLPRMTSLRCLRICSCDLDDDNMPEPVNDMERYASLLPPAPHLTQLTLTAVTACMLPPGCVQHVFGAGRHLPTLRVLELGPLEKLYALPSGLHQPLFFGKEDHGGVDAPEECFGPGDVERLVRCCPGLERLWLPCLVQTGVDVSAVLRLTALTGLFVGGAVWDDAVAVSVLAGMSGLQQLELCDAPEFTDQGLLGLVDLTRLTKLGVLCCGLSDAMPTYLDGREVTEDDEQEGCFMLWAQVRALH